MPVHPPGGGGWRVETTSSYPPTGVLVHTGFFYDTTRQYLDVISSFLEEGLKSGEPALVAVPLGNLEMIQARLGGSGGTVRFRDMSVLGRNPSRIIPAVCRFTDATAFVCEICDTGQILDPMAGRRPAGTVGNGGHGLHVVNQVCDLVELRTGPWGTAVRMHMDRA